MLTVTLPPVAAVVAGEPLLEQAAGGGGGATAGAGRGGEAHARHGYDRGYLAVASQSVTLSAHRSILPWAERWGISARAPPEELRSAATRAPKWSRTAPSSPYARRAPRCCSQHT